MKKPKDGTIIAHVQVRQSPASVKTMADWIAWRAEEDKWMEEQMLLQREAFFERLRDDPPIH